MIRGVFNRGQAVVFALAVLCALGTASVPLVFGPQPIGAWVACFGVAAGFAVWAWRYADWLRLLWPGAPDGVTYAGTRVYLHGTGVTLVEVARWELTELEWFAGKVGVPSMGRVDAYLRGGSVSFSSRPLRARFVQGPCAGLTQGNASAVHVDGEKTRGNCGHETGHKCLTALGVPSERHHEWMRLSGFPWAGSAP